MIKEKKLPSFPSMRKQYFVANGDGGGGGGEETRSGTEKRCSHNLQSGHPASWSADNCSIFPTVNIFRLFRSKKRRNPQRKSEML